MNTKKRTKLIAVMMLATLAAAGIMAISNIDDNSDAIGGTWGTITWTIDSNGTLIVSGSGTVSAADYSSYPWYSYITSIYKIIISDGITTLAAECFYNQTRVTSVEIGSTVTSIGASAFKSASDITSITFYGPQPTLNTKSFCLGTDIFNRVTATVYSSGWASSSVFTSSVLGSYTTLSYVVTSHTVTFQPNNGNNATVSVVNNGNTISTWPTDPTKTNYIFTGWYSDSGCTTLFSVSTTITADITLYAGFDLELVFTSYPVASANVIVSSSFDNTIIFSAAESTGSETISWDFGDGHTATGLYSTHTYGSSGTYTYTLTISNSLGSDVTTGTVTASQISYSQDNEGSNTDIFGIDGSLLTYILILIVAVILIVAFLREVIF